MKGTVQFSRAIAGLVVVGFLAATPLSAQQNACEVMQEGSASKSLDVGAWASYQISEGGSIKRAVVGQKELDGKTYYWMEMSMQGKKENENVITKMLVPGPESMGDIKEMIVKTAGEPAMRLPERMISMMGSRIKDPTAEAMKGCEKTLYLGEASVTVPAGTFTARHFKNEDGEMWGSEELAFFLIKVVGKEGSIEMTDHGTGATTEITGPIKDMPGF
jgi:hypothetical protein